MVGSLSATFLWLGFARTGGWGWLSSRGLGLDLINWLVAVSSRGCRRSQRCFQGVRKRHFCRLGAKPSWCCLWLQTWWDPGQSHPDWELAPCLQLMDSAASQNCKSTEADYWHLLEPIFVWIAYLSNWRLPNSTEPSHWYPFHWHQSHWEPTPFLFCHHSYYVVSIASVKLLLAPEHCPLVLDHSSPWIPCLVFHLSWRLLNWLDNNLLWRSHSILCSCSQCSKLVESWGFSFAFLSRLNQYRKFIGCQSLQFWSRQWIRCLHIRPRVNRRDLQWL